MRPFYRKYKFLPMLWVKVFHVFFVIAWMSAMFYLPRLFVYHADTHDALGRTRFELMERKLLGMMNFSATFALGFGLWLWLGWGFGGDWLWAKLVGVALLCAYHAWCWREIHRLRTGSASISSKHYRLINELPVFVLLWILAMVILKPF